MMWRCWRYESALWRALGKPPGFKLFRNEGWRGAAASLKLLDLIYGLKLGFFKRPSWLSVCDSYNMRCISNNYQKQYHWRNWKATRKSLPKGQTAATSDIPFPKKVVSLGCAILNRFCGQQKILEWFFEFDPGLDLCTVYVVQLDRRPQSTACMWDGVLSQYSPQCQYIRSSIIY